MRNQLSALLIWIRTVETFALLFLHDTCVCIDFILSRNHGFIRIFLLNKDCLFNNMLSHSSELSPNYSNSISSVENASNKRLENTEREIEFGYKKRSQTTQNQRNTKCTGHHYAQINTNNVSKRCVTLQTTGGKDEPNSVCFRKS